MSDAPVHSFVSPSSASAWTECMAMPGYVEREKHRLKPDDTTYSYEGQVAHAVAAWLLNPAMLILPEYKKYLDADKDRSTQIWLHADQHAKLVRSMMRPGDRLVVEYRAPLYYYSQHRGTIDIAIVGPDRILIIDLKYGVGVGVYAVKNKQLAIYAESLIRTLELIDPVADSVEVVMIINQPRDRNDSEPIRRWDTTRGELREFARPIGEIAQVIIRDPHSPKLKFVANPKVQCFFCKAKGICTTLAAYEMRSIDILPDDSPVDIVVAPAA